MIFRRKPRPPGAPDDAFAESVTEPDPGATGGAPEAHIQTFEAALARHEDLLYGFALYFECMALLYAGEDDIVETHRKQFRNVIQQGRETAQRAARLLDHAKLDARAVSDIEHFAFLLAEDVPQREALLRRAAALVAMWERLFRDARARSRRVRRSCCA